MLDNGFQNLVGSASTGLSFEETDTTHFDCYRLKEDYVVKQSSRYNFELLWCLMVHLRV